MIRHVPFAVPGDLTKPTGGNIYDRRMIAEFRRLDWRETYSTWVTALPTQARQNGLAPSPYCLRFQKVVQSSSTAWRSAYYLRPALFGNARLLSRWCICPWRSILGLIPPKSTIFVRVCTALTAAERVVATSETDGIGLLVPPENVVALTQALRQLISDQAGRRRFAANARVAAAHLPPWKESARLFARAIEAVAV